MITTAAALGIGMSTIVPLSKELLTEGILASTKGIVGIIGNIIKPNNTHCRSTLEVHQLIKTLDTEAEVSVIEAYIQDIVETTTTNKSTHLAIHHVSTALKDIELELKIIRDKVVYYNSISWFGSWWYGSPDFSVNIASLKNKTRILQQRFSLLIKLN
jgi:hypothetical protein